MSAIEYRQLAPAELFLVGEIDRTERIESKYVQHDARLELQIGDWSSPPWDPEGDGEHSVAAQRVALERQVEAGAIPLGAFDGDRLVGIGLVRPHVRPGVAQLAYLHVSDGYRASGSADSCPPIWNASAARQATPRWSSPRHRPSTPYASI